MCVCVCVVIIKTSETANAEFNRFGWPRFLQYHFSTQLSANNKIFDIIFLSKMCCAQYHTEYNSNNVRFDGKSEAIISRGVFVKGVVTGVERGKGEYSQFLKRTAIVSARRTSVNPFAEGTPGIGHNGNGKPYTENVVLCSVSFYSPAESQKNVTIEFRPAVNVA